MNDSGTTEPRIDDVHLALKTLEAEVELLKEQSDVDVQVLEDAIRQVRGRIHDQDVKRELKPHGMEA